MTEIMFNDLAPNEHGALAVEDDPNDFLSFPYNPDKRSRSKEAVYNMHVVPGLSDPLPHFIAGGIDSISFALALTDNVFLARGGSAIDGALNSAFATSSGPISKENQELAITTSLIIRWLRSKLVPDRVNNQLQQAPPTLLFSLGEEFARVRLKKVSDVVYKWYPDGRVRNAVVNIELFHAISGHRSPADILRRF